MARGHIRKRGTNSWELRVSAGSGPNGARRVVTRTIRGSKAAAERALTALLAELDQGAHRGPDATLGRLLDQWWARSHAGWGPATRRGYAARRRAYLADHENRRLRDVTPEWLDELYATLLAQPSKRTRAGEPPTTLAPATVYKVHAMLHDALGAAVRWGWLVWNPADRADPPSVKRRPMVVPERSKLASAVATVAKVDADYAAQLHVETVGGFRRAELLGLRWSDLDGEGIHVRRTVVQDEHGALVVQDDTKTHRARRVILDAGTLAVLEDHRLRAKDRARQLDVEVDEAYIFPRRPDDLFNPQSPDAAAQRWRRWRTKLDLDAVTLHKFRHAMCTYLLDQGVPVHDVAARAGHATANVTLGLYTHPTTEGARRAGEAAGL